MAANDIQIGGDHYQKEVFTCPNCGSEYQHWDIAWALRWDSFMYPITKYLWRHKDRIQDLKKARHYLDKYIELMEETLEPEGEPGPGYTNQDR